MRLAGHGLRWEGRYVKDGAVYSLGDAPARCECGAESEDLPTAAARKRWHMAHKVDELRHLEGNA